MEEQPKATKTCPFCAETILVGAKKCRFCGEFLATEESVVSPKPTRWNPGIAAILSLVIPGAGQMYSGRIGMGLLWLPCVVAAYLVSLSSVLGPVSPFLGLGLHGLCVWNAAGRKTAILKYAFIAWLLVVAIYGGRLLVELGRLGVSLLEKSEADSAQKKDGYQSRKPDPDAMRKLDAFVKARESCGGDFVAYEETAVQAVSPGRFRVVLTRPSGERVSAVVEAGKATCK